MSITPFTMYLITRLDGIKSLCGLFAVVLLLIGLVILVVGFLTDKTDDEFWRCLKRCGQLFVLAMVLMTFIPSKMDVLTIYTVPAVLNSRMVQKDLPAIYETAVEIILESMKPKPPESVKK